MNSNFYVAHPYLTYTRSYASPLRTSKPPRSCSNLLIFSKPPFRCISPNFKKPPTPTHHLHSRPPWPKTVTEPSTPPPPNANSRSKKPSRKVNNLLPPFSFIRSTPSPSAFALSPKSPSTTPHPLTLPSYPIQAKPPSPPNAPSASPNATPPDCNGRSTSCAGKRKGGS